MFEQYALYKYLLTEYVRGTETIFKWGGGNFAGPVAQSVERRTPCGESTRPE